MADQLDFMEEENTKLSTGLNVLTILTFIWSAYEIFSAVKNFGGDAEKLKEFDKAQEQVKNAPAWAQKFAGLEMREMLQQTIANKVPILIVGLIATSLCIYGAIEMRKQKRQGYYIWLIGEVLPFISMFLFASAFYHTFIAYFMIIPIIFIILYSFQLGNLKK